MRPPEMVLSTESVSMDSGGTVNAYTGEKDGRTGGGQPHSNMPPYLAVNIWRRTA